MQAATPEQVATIAANVEPRWQALILMAAYSGLRWGELAGLRQKHLDALKRISGVEVACLVGGNKQDTAQVARKYAIPHHTGDLGEGIERADAVILTTPTPLHRKHAEQVMRARKHVLIEIPIAVSVEDSEALLAIQKETGVVAMAGQADCLAAPGPRSMGSVRALPSG